MTDDLIQAPLTAPPGTYPAIITGLKAITMDTQYGEGQQLLEWELVLTDKHGQDYTETTLSGREATPKAKVTRWLAALGVILAPGEGLGSDKVVGKAALVVMGETEGGYTQVMDLVAPVASK